MRVRVALAVAVLIVLAALILDMSGRAPRTAGSDHYGPLVYNLTFPTGTRICQPLPSPLPADAAAVRMTVGSAGRPLPSLTVRFLGAGGRIVDEGQLARGAREGPVAVPLRRPHPAGEAVEACIRVGSAQVPIAIAGEGVPLSPASERVNGVPTYARTSLTYLRAGRESWWQLLPTLDERLGLGKAPIFGSWLLPLCAVGLLAVWVVTLRLLAAQLQ